MTRITFDNEDVTVGSLLGAGSFASVYAVELSHSKTCELEAWQFAKKRLPSRSKLRLSFSYDPSSFMSSDSTQETIEDCCKDDDQRYAIKLVKGSIDDDEMATIAAADLRKEAELLQGLPFQENVISFHGVSANFWENPAQGFVVLERLIKPLDKCLTEWRETVSSSRFPRIFRTKPAYLTRTLQAKRIQDVAIPVGKALSHLHKHGIIFRDLKPANIGFGTAGIIRLFDFGLARRVDPDKKLTGCCGTLRYMAPECALSEAYGFPADVHAFAMLLWEICTLQKPFSNFSTFDQIREAVLDKEKHPPLKSIAFIGIQALLSEAWQWEPRARPTFENLIPHLEAEVEDVVEEREQTQTKK